MSKPVVNRSGLALQAEMLRTRYHEDFETPPTPVVEMDVRERKWTAQKLLRPIEDKTGYEDFTTEDWLEVARQSWLLRREGRGEEPSLREKYQFSHLQLRQTTSHVRAKWGLNRLVDLFTYEADPMAAEEPEPEEDKYDVSDLFDWLDTDDDEDDQDIDIDDIDVNYSSDPDGDAPHQVWRDGAGKKVKLY